MILAVAKIFFTIRAEHTLTAFAGAVTAILHFVVAEAFVPTAGGTLNVLAYSTGAVSAFEQ